MPFLVHREHQHGHLRMPVPDLGSRHQAFDGVRRWHADVGDDDVRHIRLDQLHELTTVGGTAGHLASRALQKAGQAFAEQG